jgi:hypothetical protein
MADECDIASDCAQWILDAVLAKQRHGVSLKLMAAPGGLCANDCGEPAMPGAACCSRECVDDIDRRRKIATMSCR